MYHILLLNAVCLLAKLLKTAARRISRGREKDHKVSTSTKISQEKQGSNRRMCGDQISGKKDDKWMENEILPREDGGHVKAKKNFFKRWNQVCLLGGEGMMGESENIFVQEKPLGVFGEDKGRYIIAGDREVCGSERRLKGKESRTDEII